MPKGPFEGAAFIPTKFSSGEDKAQFGNTFLHFVRSEWKRALFTGKFYNRLSMTFGNIAHNDIHGFYNTWFERDADRLAFLEQTLRYPCYGQPEFTFCDVERAIQIELRTFNLVPVYRQRIELATRSHEIRELTRLQNKYGVASIASDPSVANENTSPRAPSPIPPSVPVFEPGPLPIQGTLF
jgi:hypothetical protein